MHLFWYLSRNLFKKFNLFCFIFAQIVFFKVVPLFQYSQYAREEILIIFCMEAQFRFKRDCRTFTKTWIFSKQFQFLERLCFKEKPKIMSFCSISLSDLATCSFKFISLRIYTCRRKRELIILYIKRPGKTCGHILKETD